MVVSVSCRLAQRVSHLPQGTGLEGVEPRQCESGARMLTTGVHAFDSFMFLLLQGCNKSVDMKQR